MAELAHLGVPIRCAIYARKSTEEGLEQAFNSLQAQREAAEAYVLSQRQKGWIALPECYDDGGFSGANMERPALQRLLADVETSKVDCILVYKVDRLTRSLLDFARLRERFDRRGVSFVSVTQEFNTTTSLGRLTLNILLSFAQFEREIISERTRDKLSAARRKGKWIGGWLVLGYDVDARGGRLVINEQEAEQVRQMFRMAAEVGTLEAAWRAADACGFRTKAWTSKKGSVHPPRPFSRMSLRRLLSNVLYTGVVLHHGTRYAGEHERIVEQELWEKVNRRLEVRAEAQRGRRHGRQIAPLAGLLSCSECGFPMLLASTTRHRQRYFYYSCQAARRKHQALCSQRPVAAIDLETSLLLKLQPTLGLQPNWPLVHGSLESVTYEWSSGRVSVRFKDQTGFAYTLSAPVRPGVSGRPAGAEEGRIPRVSRLLALAIKFQRLVGEGAVRNYRDLAEAGQISRARMSQIMRLTDLAPDIQEELLFLPKTIARGDRITEKSLREIARSMDWEVQRKQFRSLAEPQPDC